MALFNFGRQRSSDEKSNDVANLRGLSDKMLKSAVGSGASDSAAATRSARQNLDNDSSRKSAGLSLLSNATTALSNYLSLASAKITELFMQGKNMAALKEPSIRSEAEQAETLTSVTSAVPKEPMVIFESLSKQLKSEQKDKTQSEAPTTPTRTGGMGHS